MVCPSCGKAGTGRALFCGGCGASLVVAVGNTVPRAVDPQPADWVPYADAIVAPEQASPTTSAVAGPLGARLSQRGTGATSAAAASVPAVVALCGARRRPGSRAALIIAALLAVLVGGGVVGARMLTLTVVSARGPMADLLPASTVLYASANLQPDGAQGTNLQALTAAFTDRPGFARIRKLITDGIAAKPGQPGCHAQAPFSWDDMRHSWINGRMAVAVTDPAALGATGSNTQAARDSIVGIIGLRVTLTLGDVFSHFRLGTAAQSSSYNGVTIYSIRSDSTCGPSLPTTSGVTGYATLLNGYAVIGASPASVEREIDVYQGKLPKLSESAGFKRLGAAIPADGLAFAYLDTPTLVRSIPGGSPYLSTLPASLRGMSTDPRYADARGALGPSGLALTAKPTGFDLQAVQLSNVPLPSLAYTTPNAAARALPDGTIFYLSLDNLKALYDSATGQLRKSGLLDARSLQQTNTQVGDALGLLDGEYAFALLPTDMNAASHLSGSDTTGLPLVAMIDLGARTDAPLAIRRTLAGFDSGPSPFGLVPSHSPRGAAIYAASAGYGYALIKNWLVISPSIKAVTASMEGTLYGGKPSLAGGSIYGLLHDVIGGKQTEVMLLDLGSLRTGMEALLPRGSATIRDRYETIRPLLVPIRALALSATAEDGGKTERADLFLAIAR